VNARLRAACIVGWPVAHSRSPLIHNYWLKRYGIAGEYRREAVPPQEFADFARALAERGYVGANVTVPHKEAALALSQPDERAREVGAANTLWFDGDALRSTNTDVEGFLDNLGACAPQWDRGLDKAVVLGAGGAARGVIYGLIRRGVSRIIVVNRTRSRAENLRQRFGEAVHPADWSDNSVLADAGLVVNATVLGMAGQPELPLDVRQLPGHAVVAELVYAPRVTPLLRAARERGLRSADGLGMLMYQAVRGFALWFGKTPEVTAELRTLLEADLGASADQAGGIT
jgi:shikimate dehydrogenase